MTDRCRGSSLHAFDRTTFDLMEYTSDLVVVVGAGGEVVRLSRSAGEHLGDDRESLVGRAWRDLVHPADLDLVAAGAAPAGHVEGAVPRFRLRSTGGAWRWFELVAVHPLHRADGQGSVVVARAFDHLLEAERLRTLLHAMTRLANESTDFATACATAVDAIRGAMQWSAGGHQFAAGARPPRSDLGDQRLSTPVAEAVREQARQSARVAWEIDGDVPARELLHIAIPIPVNGSVAAILSFVSQPPEPVSDALLEVLANVGSQLGVVASRQADRGMLERREEELERSNAELERFAYVASHDLQEPLRKVVTACELLERRYAEQLTDLEGAGRYVGIAVDAARRMQTLIRDLLAYSRVGRPNGEPDTEVDLEAVVADVSASLSEQMDDAGVVVDVGPLPSVRGSAHELRQVVANLLSNALKFAGDRPPSVAVNGYRHDREVEITVTDNGIGIDPAYAEQIFDVFRRLHRQDEYSGTGIGLAIAKRIVEHRGGRIWVTPAPGGGSRFHFTIPTGDHA